MGRTVKVPAKPKPLRTRDRGVGHDEERRSILPFPRSGIVARTRRNGLREPIGAGKLLSKASVFPRRAGLLG